MKINFKLNTKTILSGVVILWGIFAIWYVANDQWQDFQVREMKESYQLGKSDTIKMIIDQTSTCQQQVPINYDDRTVNLVSVECLQKAQVQQQPNQSPENQSSVK